MKKILLFLFLLAAMNVSLFSPASAAAHIGGQSGAQLYTADTAPCGGEARYQFLVTNSDSSSHTYSLLTSGLPSDYTASFYTDNKTASAVDIAPGGSRTIELKVQIPQAVAVNTAFCSVMVKREDGIADTIPLSVLIKKDYALSVVTQIQGLTAISGQNAAFDLTLANTGSKTIENVRLKFELPHKWIVQRLTPDKLDLNPGEEASFHVELLIPVSQAAGNEKIQVTAFTDNTSSSPLTIPVQVQKNPNYLLWALVLVVLTGTATIYYFHKHGRR